MSTNFDINAYFSNPENRQAMSTRVKSVKCKDGFRVSVQASECHYCSPRNNIGPWTQVELGFPSSAPEFGIMDFVEDPENPTGTVYGYVPVDLVNKLIDFHGGLAE